MVRSKNHFDFHVASRDIADMVKEKGKNCISVIIPTHRIGQDRQADPREVRRAIFAAGESLGHLSNKYLIALDELSQGIDYLHNEEGVGLFVSPDIRKIIKFPFPVSKRIAVGKFFDLQDILYAANYDIDYYVLDISQRETHLYHGLRNHLEEVCDTNFPKRITEEYEYSKPTPGSSFAGYARVKSFEKDKTILKKIRVKQHYRIVDSNLPRYLEKKDTVLLLWGTESDVAAYKSITNFANKIAASIHDHNGLGIHDLRALSWLGIQSLVNGQKAALLAQLKEKIGKGLVVVGPEKVREAASAGRGLQLLFEKNYAETLAGTGPQKITSAVAPKVSVNYHEVLNEITNTVLEKQGTVTVFEEDNLEEYKRIALILRY